MKHRGSEWTPIYMLIVMVIAAIIVVRLVKPVFQQASASAGETLEEAKTAARAASLIFFLRPWKKA